MGEVSTVLVPKKSYVRIPVSKKGNSNCEKHKVCQCGNDGVIEHCSPMPCLKASNCSLMGPDHIKGQLEFIFALYILPFLVYWSNLPWG